MNLNCVWAVVLGFVAAFAPVFPSFAQAFQSAAAGSRPSDPWPRVLDLANGQVLVGDSPAIYMSQVPAELIVFKGRPDFPARIDNTMPLTYGANP
jgi:hypothetical protein